MKHFSPLRIKGLYIQLSIYLQLLIVEGLQGSRFLSPGVIGERTNGHWRGCHPPAPNAPLFYPFIYFYFIKNLFLID